MRPIYFTIGVNNSLMIIPDTQAHLDGHLVLTQTYHIYKKGSIKLNKDVLEQDNRLGLNKSDDPNYLGYITFEVPDKMFSYTADGKDRLDREEIEELIEQISNYRNNPDVWPTNI
jgi:hypothetical protein